MFSVKKTYTMSAAAKQLWGYPYPGVISKRARFLQINSKDLRELSLAGLKKLAKKNFGILIKPHHPDTRRNHKNKLGESPIFRRLILAHRFINNLTENDIEKFRQIEIQEVYYPVPWEWEKQISIPEGFQEIIRR